MYKWILFLGIVSMTGCANSALRCDGRLTAINPPVMAASPAPGVARGGR